MRIIGHRGAAGVALENTKSSIKKALGSGVEAIEIDVRKTKDDHLVLCHDQSLLRVASNPIVVAEELLKTLEAIELDESEQILSLRGALETIKDCPVIIELKDDSSTSILLKTLKDFPTAKVSVASFYFEELLKLQDLAPKLKLYALEQTKPIETLQRAKAAGFFGVGLNFWLLNPVTYFWARKNKIDLYVYTVNSRWLVSFISKLYPKVAICTDFPGRFQKKTKIRKLHRTGVAPSK